MEDVDIGSIIPTTFWMKNPKCKYLLAVMVHRHNKEIARNVTDLPSGCTRQEQRETARGRVESERQASREEENQSARLAEDTRHAHQFKHLKLSAAKASILKTETDSISIQLSLYHTHKEAYVSAMGETHYNNRVAELIDSLPNVVQNRLYVDDVDLEPSEAEENAF